MADEDQVEIIIQDDPQDIAVCNAILDNIKASISSNQLASAIKVAAATFPPQNIRGELKNTIVTVWASIFSYLPANDQIIADFTPEQCTSVAIYATKVMALLGDKKQTENALSWYGKVVAKQGPGVISRVITNRK